MSTTPTANTLLPPAVRVAKLIGTVGSAYAAGAYLTNSMHVLPSIARTSSTKDLSLALYKLHNQLSKPLLAVSSVSSTAFAFIAYYLYRTPSLVVPMASIAFAPGTFLSHVEYTEFTVGGGWELYAIAAGAMAAVVPWQIFGVGRVEKRIQSVGQAIAAAETLKTPVVEDKLVRTDAKKWAQGHVVAGALAALAAGVGGYAVAWW